MYLPEDVFFEGTTVYIALVSCKWIVLYRSVGFTGDAAAAVHYALHYLGNLVEVGGDGKRSCCISDDEVLHPRLQLPDMFELLHHSNHVAPMFILESIVGKISQLLLWT